VSYRDEWPDDFTDDEVKHIAGVAGKRMPKNHADRADFWQTIQLHCWRELQKMNEPNGSDDRDDPDKPEETRLARLEKKARSAAKTYWREKRLFQRKRKRNGKVTQEAIKRREFNLQHDAAEDFWEEVAGQQEEAEIDEDPDAGVRDLLRCLADAEARVFSLIFYSRMSFRQVAGYLGKKLGTVQTLWGRAVRKLRCHDQGAVAQLPDLVAFLKEEAEEDEDRGLASYNGPRGPEGYPDVTIRYDAAPSTNGANGAVYASFGGNDDDADDDDK
jgi:RNA polymerase sigma factor (sigma-70 family)